MRIKNYFLVLFLFAFSAIHAQVNEITGTVLDANAMPLPGANILVKGTDQGTQTDFDGNFTIDASSQDILVISYIGFKTLEFPVGQQTNLKITLSEFSTFITSIR